MAGTKPGIEFHIQGGLFFLDKRRGSFFWITILSSPEEIDRIGGRHPTAGKRRLIVESHAIGAA